MGGEYILPESLLGGFGKGGAFLHEFARPLQGQEGGMTFVHVPDCGFASQGAQGAYAAHAEQNFLHYAAVEVRPVQTGGELAVKVTIALHIGVEQVKRNAPHAHFPNLGGDIAVGEFNLNGDGLFVFGNQRNGQVFKGQRFVDRFLPAVFADALGEISLGVHEANSHERQAEVGGFFQVVARQHAQSA